MSGQPLLSCQGLRFARGRRWILESVELQLAAGEILALLGVNGAGKTTLLRCLLGLLPASAGTIQLGDTPLQAWSRRQRAQRLAYVPQLHGLPFPFSVRHMVAMGRLPHHGPLSAPDRHDLALVDKAMEQMGITHLARRPYTELSGGERQLTLIARALAQGSGVLVMDEPTAGLDYGHQIRLLQRLQQLAADGYGILMTSHQPDQVLAWASRVALLEQGRISAIGPADEVLTSQAIERLYQVEVELVQAQDGRAALLAKAAPTRIRD